MVVVVVSSSVRRRAFVSACSIPLRSSFANTGGIQRQSTAAAVAAINASVTLDEHDAFASSAVVIREVGPCRSVFVLRPHLTEHELKGLANRLRTLSRNGSLNSVLLSTHEESAVTDGRGRAFPLSVHARTLEFAVGDLDDSLLGAKELDDEARHCLGGLDPRSSPPESWDGVLEGVRDLTLAANDAAASVPIIACAHGVVSDGGFASLTAPYALVTGRTELLVDHPARGLALDPAGLSFVLPRVGRDAGSRPVARRARSIAALIALAGARADAHDMLATGLATHLLDADADREVAGTLATLEDALARSVPARERQGLVPPPPRTSAERARDHERRLETGESEPDAPNRRFRNLAVHRLVDQTSCGRAGRNDSLVGPTTRPHEWCPYDETEAALLDSIAGRELVSDLLDYATEFREILERDTVEGILEGLREEAASADDDPYRRDVTEMAGHLAREMERRSPLALRAVHALLEKGGKNDATMKDSVERELVVQKNLLRKEDFQRWRRTDPSDGPPEWTHASVADVTDDEVEELFHEA